MPPFDFDLSAHIYFGGDELMVGYAGHEYWKVLGLNSKLVLARIKSVGSVDEPTLSVKLASGAIITVSSMFVINCV